MFFTFINCAILTTLASFVTLCGQRQLNNQLPWSPKHSVCDNCHHPLSWWQLIPILGFIIQRGHCHWCDAKISPFFPLSELTIILVTAWTFTSSWYHNLIFAIVILTLLYLSTTDFVSQVIYPIALIGLLPLLLVLPRQSLSIGKVTVELVIIGLFLLGLQHITKGLGINSTNCFNWLPANTNSSLNKKEQQGAPHSWISAWLHPEAAFLFRLVSRLLLNYFLF